MAMGSDPGEATSADKAAIIEAIIAISSAAEGEIAAVLREYEAPASSARTIRIIATRREPTTPRDLAQLLGRDPSTATLIADRLADVGLVERRAHPADGRKRVLVLTERGDRLWSDMRDRLHGSVRLDRLAASERASLLDLLARISTGG